MAEQKYLDYIFANWQQFAAYAWRSYSQFGRGMVVLDWGWIERMRTAKTAGGYVRLDYSSMRQPQPEPIIDLLKEYDPNNQIIVFIQEGAEMNCFMVDKMDKASPPDAYKAEEAKRN